MLENLKQFYKKNPKEFGYRLLSIALSSFILPNIILLLFVVYMENGNFFSYDFFTDGVFGMKLFFVITIIMTFTILLIFSGGIIVLFGNYKKHPYSSPKEWWWIFLLNFSVFLSSVIGVCLKLIPLQWFIFLFIISIAICTHLSMLLFYDAKKQFISFIVFMSIVFFLTTNMSEQTARLLSFALKSFGIGGYIDTQIKIKSDEIKNGKLILLTPKAVYIKPNNRTGVEIFQIDYIESIYIGNDINTSKSITKR